MRKEHLFILSLCAVQSLAAQSFTEQIGTPFKGTSFGSAEFADINNDGSLDVIITGILDDNEVERIAELYTNDGAGNFTLVTGTPFEGVAGSSVEFADVNEDGHTDVLIAGAVNTTDLIARLYINDGTGTFTELANSPFDGVFRGDVAFSDVNGDGSPDVFITGPSDVFFNDRIAKLYINDGLGNFTEIDNTPFDGVYDSSVAVADVDGDNDPDVLISGDTLRFGDGQATKLYINDGLGNFAEDMGNSFVGVRVGDIQFTDVDGDGSQDVLIIGDGGSSDPTVALYINDGLGNFTKRQGNAVEGLISGSVAFGDVNGNGSPDLLIAGAKNQFEALTKLYANDGAGNFIEVATNPFDTVFDATVALVDVNDDGRTDVFINGSKAPTETGLSERIAKLYLNDGTTSTTDRRQAEASQLLLSPNPVFGSKISVKHNWSFTGEVIISIYNIAGTRILQQSRSVKEQHSQMDLDIESLSPGWYLLQVGFGKRQGLAKFIVK